MELNAPEALREVADGLDGYERVCPLDDVWQGEMLPTSVNGVPVLLVHTDAGGVHAVQAHCPHQAVSLADGSLNGDVLTCPMHLWEMNVATGRGVNPSHAEIARYPLKVIDGAVWVSCAGVEPKHCRP